MASDLSDISDFGNRLQYLFRRIDGALSQRLDDDLRPYGITQGQLSALAQLHVARPGALSGAELSHRAGITPQSMSTALAGLLSRGLVAREPSPGHGRRLDVRITDAGAELLLEVQRVTAERDAGMDLGLDDREEEELRALLRRVAERLGVYLPAR
jgi:DNA-binding MarR family transcriptional regulator